MDCRSALEILDCARPAANDLQQPEFIDATAHAATCAACDETFRERQLLDRRIGELMRDVTVPAGLLERLSAGVAAIPVSGEVGNTEAIPPVGVTPSRVAKSPGRFSSRRSRLFAGLAACVSLAAAIFILTYKPAPTLAIAEITEVVPLDQSIVDRLVEFDGSFDAAMPVIGWNSPVLSLDMTRGFGKTKAGKHQMALVRFSYPARDTSSLMGMLAIIPKDAVKDADTLGGSFLAGQGNYTTRGSGVYATVSWTEGDMVYVCFVPDTEEARERLKQVLVSVPA
jgi:hypothetical protein